jgi:hypothetical protein
LIFPKSSDEFLEDKMRCKSGSDSSYANYLKIVKEKLNRLLDSEDPTSNGFVKRVLVKALNYYPEDRSKTTSRVYGMKEFERMKDVRNIVKNLLMFNENTISLEEMKEKILEKNEGKIISTVRQNKS